MKEWYRSEELQAEYKTLGHYIGHFTQEQARKFARKKTTGS